MQIADKITQQSSHPYDYWLKKNWYYHGLLARFYQWMIPETSTVLQIGCKTAHLLNAVKPNYGVGVDSEQDCLSKAWAKFSQYTFAPSISQIPAKAQFDYIILSSITMEIDDIQDFLQSLLPFCHSRTRIILDMYSFWWEPLLRFIQKIGWRRPTKLKNWVCQQDMKNFFGLSNYEVISSGRTMLVPCYIPFCSWFINTFIAALPIINRLCLMEWIVARPLSRNSTQNYSVSVIVPCKNERGNIYSIVQTIPSMGKSTEIIFVEGNSSDGTFEQIEQVIKNFPEKNVSAFKQNGSGKGDAVRKGFAHATSDILMILDSDLAVPACELPKFYDALLANKADFINGSRLVYGMEADAMRWLNLLANYLFGIGFSWVLNQPIKDTLCGTKVLFKKDYALIEKNRSCFGDFDPFGDFDLLFGAAKLHLKIIDMPIHYKARTYGVTQIRRFYHGLLLLRMSLFAAKKFKFRS